MKKLIMSMVAAPLLVTSAFALEDIKVNGQAKLWYETSNSNDGTMFNTEKSSAEVVFKLGMTGKQGDVSFGTTIYQSSTMGLEGTLVGAARTNAVNGDMFVGEAYIVAPLGGSTITKIGKQELDTPLAFTERWNAMPNTFNAAVVLNNSIDNLTLLGAYVGQDNATSWKVDGEVNQKYFGATGAAAALYKADALAANVWLYYISGVGGNYAVDGAGDLVTPINYLGGINVAAAWADVGVKIGDSVNVKGYVAFVSPDGEGAAGEATIAAAASAGAKLGGVSLFGAASMVTEDGLLPVANTSTGFKKTKLPTAGVYTDGVYVAQPGSIAAKIKASGKLGSTGLALQAITNINSDARYEGLTASGDNIKDTTEIDLIISQKLGVFNNKLILMQRMMGDADTGDTTDATHVRLVTSVNF